MTDIHSKAKRSELMSKIRSTDNASTELSTVAIFRALGITGWRRGRVIRGAKPEASHHKRFSVKPDFIFPKLKTAVFVDGCFWHGCPQHATQPKTNAGFWRDKIAGNQARDRTVNRQLRALGWKVVRIWEHELARKNTARLLRRLRVLQSPT